jgi:hypothetical protein
MNWTALAAIAETVGVRQTSDIADPRATVITSPDRGGGPGA